MEKNTDRTSQPLLAPPQLQQEPSRPPLATLTPLMKQYWEIKSLHPDKILLFRMGDFFEMFFEDAVKAAPLLGIALTSRNKKAQDETPMCGVPHHSVAGPINKLLSLGNKVAICDQIEDPKFAKGLVKRAVTRILTPGMVYDPDTLEQSLPYYLASLDENSLSCVDTSTGEAFYFLKEDTPSVGPSSLGNSFFLRLLKILPVVELVVETSHALPKDISEALGKEELQFVLSPFSDSQTSLQDAIQAPLQAFSSDASFQGALQGAWQGSLKAIPQSASRLLSYINHLSGEDGLKTIKNFEHRKVRGRMALTLTSLRHLEIFSTYLGQVQGSLFFAINRTETSAGARRLRQFLSFPLTQEEDIDSRLNQVQTWTQDLPKLKKLREILAQMGDLERRLGKVNQPQCNGRDLRALSDSIEKALSAYFWSSSSSESLLTFLDSLKALSEEIKKVIVEEPPLLTRQGHLIQKGVSENLDELIVLSTDSQSLIQKMETEEREKTQISSLKIRYNSVFGYYIEITNTHKDKAPSHYMRKQTLANAERYCTEELIELERKVLSAQSKRADLEFEIFEQLRKKVLSFSMEILSLASFCSELDVYSSLAWLALENNYVRPQFKTKGALRLLNSRHPVVEESLKKKRQRKSNEVLFVPNTIELSPSGVLLLTGPNMAGKSTLMRQVALTAILAQMGSYVPADEAFLPIFDQIFTRIGASDQLSEGLSTFMVEMTETSEMIQNATSKSLLILDEVGRGTSTYDGMSLAQAILEYIITHVRAMTLFATHYHEITQLAQSYPHLKNAHMSVIERGGEIRFLHTLVHGPALKSYGIQVARLAGLPLELTNRAKKILTHKEDKKNNFELFEREAELPQMSFFEKLHFSAEEPRAPLREEPSQEAEAPLQEAPLQEELSQKEFSKETPFQERPVLFLSQLVLPQMSFFTLLGTLEKERLRPQEIQVDLRIKFKQIPGACESDEVTDSLCYGVLVEHLRAVVEEREYKTIEALTMTIYKRLKSKFLGPHDLELRVKKISPPIKELKGGACFELRTESLSCVGKQFGDPSESSQ